MGKSRDFPGRLAVLGFISALAYGAVALSGQSLHKEGSGGPSLLTILGLFGICFVCYLASIRIAIRSSPSSILMVIIIGGGVVFRGLLLFADPIEEIDIYRYLWDGAASVNSVSPLRYAPQQVLAAQDGDGMPDDLAKLVAVRDRSPALTEILNRVHFAELPTIYPPVSQVVFALATATTPVHANVAARMTIMKAWFVGFDLLTIVMVFNLLRLCGLPSSGVIIYAWCPLVIKEFANSGHLDSLAVFLSTLACYVSARTLFPTARPSSSEPNDRAFALYTAAFVFGLAAGAKLYPVVLAPLFLATVLVRRRWRAALSCAVIFLATTVTVLYPMFPTGGGAAWKPPASVEQADAELAPLPPEDVGVSPRDPSQSLRAFLSYWEMNDFLFLLVMENVRPTAGLPADERAWFSIVPESWRSLLTDPLIKWFRLDANVAPFMFTRSATSATFVLLAGFFAFRAAHSSSSTEFLRYGFLTIAWFWLLQPTGNPWYWTWAMPFLPFARSRVWHTVAGLVMLYYLRFWLVFHFSDMRVLQTPYRGGYFFDYVVTWLEFAPWFVALAWCSASARCGETEPGSQPSIRPTS